MAWFKCVMLGDSLVNVGNKNVFACDHVEYDCG